MAALALASLGVPDLLSPGTSGAPGLVVDERGYGVEDAVVLLFSETRRRLLEETRTDRSGEFRLQLDAPDARVFVTPPPGSGLVPAWGPPAVPGDRPDRPGLVLRRARSLEVHVADELGRAVPGAEVRVHDARADAAVVVLATTDVLGTARVVAPARASVSVVAPPPVPIGRWRLDVDVPEHGAELAFRLPPARMVIGRVTAGDRDTDVAGVVIVSAERDAGDATGPWNGFAHTGADGAFAVPVTDATAELVALDPLGRFLPRRIALPHGADAVPPVALARGAPLEVHVRHAGEGLASRVYGWDPRLALWGWGARTDLSGTAVIPVSSPCGLRADPLDPAHGALERWDVPFEESPTLLEAGTTP